MTNVSVPGWAFRFVALLLLFITFYAAGALAVFGLIPDLQPEPGLVPAEIAIMIIAVANTLLLMGLVLSSCWSGWKLAFWLAFAYYGAVTFIMQIETWYFLTGLTVGAELLPRLFLMGLPVAVFVVPLAVWILGKGRPSSYYNPDPVVPSMPVQQWVWRLAVIAAVYIVLYWTAGYFIAWQNPELRAFLRQPGRGPSLLDAYLKHTAARIGVTPVPGFTRPAVGGIRPSGNSRFKGRPLVDGGPGGVAL